MRYLEFDLLRQAAPGADFQSAASILDPLREIKEPGEIESMQRAVLVAEQALQATLPQIQVGMTESELAAELFAQLLRAGSAPEIPFSPIVAGGPNSALPHHDPGERKLAPGDLLIIDWGATVDGYVSDITRTFAVAEIDPALVPAYQAVQEANRAGRQAARPGVSCGDLDRAARQVIDEAGFGAYFIHRLGHGLGLEGHEPPYLRGDNRALFQAGMTFTVEPGVYLSGRGGVRIEDDVVITEQGATSLTTLDRDLRVVGTG
jgi:Xaa-Pro dipeptidase